MQPLFSPDPEPTCPLDYIPLRLTQGCFVFLQCVLAEGGRETGIEIQWGMEAETVCRNKFWIPSAH